RRGEHEPASGGAERGDPGARCSRATWSPAPTRAGGATMTFDVAATLADRRILVVGATGFVGKVALSLLLHRYPNIARAFVLVRPGARSTSEERFFGKV